jgi:glycosyltransferase involved in cell wall biosynthesis
MNLVQDIEDAPTEDEKGFRGALNRMSFGLTFRLTNARKMVVADHVAKELGLDDFVTIRGVAAQEQGAVTLPNVRKWGELRTGSDLRLHFGGSLIAETGVDLFCEAVEQLASSGERLPRRVIFQVTGIGQLDKILILQQRVGSNAKVVVELYPELKKSDYLALIDNCHGSLSLKRPGAAMSDTTFPSKVIEITAAGLALVTTRLGDIPELFGADEAYFLPEYEPESLVEIFVAMAAYPERVERVAAAGRTVCGSTFSLASIGQEMIRLL